MPGAVGNSIFNAALRADEAGGAGPLPLVLTDLSTATSFVSEGAWVVRDPGYDFQTEAQPKEWLLENDRLVPFHGSAV